MINFTPLSFVQPAFDLLSVQEIAHLFYGGLGYGPPSAVSLAHSASYEAPLSADDQHIMVKRMKTLTISMTVPA